jgi:regulator of sigma E protease
MSMTYGIMYNIFFFIIIMSIVVFIHEMGHYLVAKFSGVKIESFSIGFGREIYGFNDKSGTRWKFSWLPLGGYVKMFGDRDPASNPDLLQIQNLSEEEKKHTFFGKPVGIRAAIVAAGPIANFLFAIIVFTTFVLVNGRVVASPIVKEVVENMPAQIAGLRAGDKILTIDGHNIKDFSDIETLISINPGRELLFQIERQADKIQVHITPQKITTQNGLGSNIEVGRIGVVSEMSQVKDYNLFEALKFSVEQTYKMCEITLIAIKQILIGERNADQLSGPIRIAKYSGETAKHGIVAIIGFMAMLSINLGLVNLLPIPLLDGGHLALYAIEVLKGSPLNIASQNFLMRIGIIILFGLMLFSTFNDIRETVLR